MFEKIKKKSGKYDRHLATMGGNDLRKYLSGKYLTDASKVA